MPGYLWQNKQFSVSGRAWEADMAVREPTLSHNAVINNIVPIINALRRNGILLERNEKTLEACAYGM
jgi:hypothetical protein